MKQRFTDYVLTNLRVAKNQICILQGDELELFVYLHISTLVVWMHIQVYSPKFVYLH